MKTIKVVAAIIHKDQRILIAKRNYGEYAGFYEFPGGKVEAGETGEQAICREILEELNVRLHVESFFMNVQHDYPTFHLDMDCFLCTLIDEELMLESHSEIQWITLDADNINWCPADVKVYEALSQSYRGGDI